MKHGVLLVDDEPNLLQGLTRMLHGLHRLQTAPGGAEGLRLLEAGTDFAVIISDMRMPGMNGIEFLRAAKQVAPMAVRVMLTGNADQDTAIQAINDGCVFRFVTKPCSKAGLLQAIDAAIDQHLLLTAEKELLEETLAGSVQALTEILAMLDARMFGKCTTLRDLVRRCAPLVPKDERWEVETAAMLAPLGSVAIPPIVMMRSRKGAELTVAERAMLERIPEVGFQLLSNIPRLERVANMVRHQRQPAGTGIPLGSRLLRILHDALEAAAEHESVGHALASLHGRPDYDLGLLDEVRRLLGECEAAPVSETGDLTEALPLRGLQAGQVTAQAIRTTEGTVLVGSGQTVTPTLLERLRNFAATIGVIEPIVVQRPRATSGTRN